ncbi:hypothetical protein DITRI_Ditri16bG0123500 [Diplodiscus trichospermus]
MASAAAARAVIFSRIIALSAKPLPPSLRCFLPNRRNRTASAVTVSCCLNGGGVSDDYFVSTQKSNLDRGFLVIANMLKHIEPLDTSVISKGISDSAKESMKRTISTMLGILPSDQFSVLVSLSKPPLHGLLFSSIITGYTLWNAEYRVSLMRNLERAAPAKEVAEETEESDRRQKREVVEEKMEKRDCGSGGFEELEKIRPRVFGDLSPQALNYIEKLQAELSDVEEELSAQKNENVRIECDRENRNDLLEYLRSLDADMVTELSQPSSVQVEEIIHQLVQNILQRLFKDELMRNSGIVNTGNHQDAAPDENCGTVGTSRDYLAKLLFWCMLLGHHLRGAEDIPKICTDHKVPKADQLGWVHLHLDLPMASLYHSNAANLQDLDAMFCKYSPSYLHQDHAGSIYDQWPQHLHQKPTKMVEENPTGFTIRLRSFKSTKLESEAREVEEHIFWTTTILEKLNRLLIWFLSDTEDQLSLQYEQWKGHNSHNRFSFLQPKQDIQVHSDTLVPSRT